MRCCYKGKKLLGIILMCIGIGTLLVIILPFWGWLALTSIGFIAIGWYYYKK